MNNSKAFGAVVLIVLLNTIALIYLFSQRFLNNEKKLAFVLTQKVFEQYKGTKEARKKMVELEQLQKKQLDSMSLGVKILETKFGQNDTRVIKEKEKFNSIYRELLSNNEKLSEDYDNGIWTQINQHINTYGKNKGFVFIYGANGNGSIMYADSLYNATNEVIQYVNNKYDGN